jgi:hypothetical protein
MRAILRIGGVAVVVALAASRNHAQEFAWVKRFAGMTDGTANAITLDSARNIYTVGYFTTTTDFDPGPGTYNLSTANVGLYVSKLDSQGQFVWASAFRGNAFAEALGVAVDAAGNVYTVGYFGGSFDFDPGAQTHSLMSAGGWDAFIVKLDSAGNYVWASRLGGTGDDYANAVALDPAGNVLVVGSFEGTVDFDPGAGTDDLTSAGGSDAYIAKFSASGGLVWAKRIGGSIDDSAAGVAVNPVSEIYTVGSFQGAVDFDPGAGTYDLTSAGSSDAFISKLDASGNFVWAKQLGGTSTDVASVVALDSAGNVHTAGTFEGTADFDPGPGTRTLTATGPNDMFVSKLDASGNFVWARRMGGDSIMSVKDLTVDSYGNVYTVGWFEGTIDFDPGPGVHNLTSSDPLNDNGFVSRLDNLGQFVWAQKLQQTFYDYANGVNVDAVGNVFVAGEFDVSADFDPGLGTYVLASAGGFDGFVWKLSQACSVFSNESDYGALLFGPHCAADASALPGAPGEAYAYDSRTLDLRRGASDHFYLSGSGTSFSSLLVDDAVHIAGQDAGLGPYATQPGVPPYLIGLPIERNFVPEPPPVVTSLIPTGTNAVLFEALDTDRAIYGNTAVYLVRDCGLHISGRAGGPATLGFVSYDVDQLGMQSDIKVVTGLLSQLRSDHDFNRATCLGTFFNTTQAADTRPDPVAGDGYYYLIRGTCWDGTFGHALGVSPDPREALNLAGPCP